MIMTMIMMIVMMIMMIMIITMVVMTEIMVLDQFQGCSALPARKKGVTGESITLTVIRLNWQLLARSLRLKP